MKQIALIASPRKYSGYFREAALALERFALTREKTLFRSLSYLLHQIACPLAQLVFFSTKGENSHYPIEPSPFFYAIAFSVHSLVPIYIYYTCIAAYLETPGAPNVDFSLCLSIYLSFSLRIPFRSLAKSPTGSANSQANRPCEFELTQITSVQIFFDGGLIRSHVKRVKIRYYEYKLNK